MIATLSKQGGRRYPQMRSFPVLLSGPLMSSGETQAAVGLVGFRYELDGPSLGPYPLIGPDTEEDDASQPYPRYELQ